MSAKKLLLTSEKGEESLETLLKLELLKLETILKIKDLSNEKNTTRPY